MPSITLSSGARFPALAETSILEAATRAGLALPHGCMTGRCGACKSRVLQGATRPLQQETGLSRQELSDGWILSCARTADTDLVLDVEDLSRLALPMPRTWPCRISEINRLAPDVARVRLRLPPSADFHFVAGQYIDVIGHNGIRRSYSLACADAKGTLLELHIRAVEKGEMSEYWFNQAAPNDLLRLHGPLGTCVLRETAGIDLFFLATGTGIAPVKAMLESLTRLHPEHQPAAVTVLWGGRHSSDHYLDRSDLQGAHTFIPVRSLPDGAWVGATGHVQDVLLASNPRLDTAAVYACGSNAMIQGARQRLVQAGLPPERFHSDAFVSSGPPDRTSPC